MREEVNNCRLQGTIDLRIVNTIRRFFESKGADIRSVAALQRIAFQLLEDIVVRMGTPICESTEEATYEMRRITYGKSLFENRSIVRSIQTETGAIEEAVNRLDGWNSSRMEEAARIAMKKLGLEPPKREVSEEKRRMIELETQKLIQMVEEQKENNKLTEEEVAYGNVVYQLTILKLEEYDKMIALAKTGKERKELEEKRARVPRFSQQASEDKRFFNQLKEA